MSTRVLTSASLVAALAGSALSQADAPMPNPPEFPFENQFSEEKNLLGKILFFDEQMSSSSTVACATCHINEVGGTDPRAVTDKLNPGPDGTFGTDDDVAGSPGVIAHMGDGMIVSDPTFGVGEQVTGRKAPTHINGVYFNDLFWDGRATDAFTDPQTGLVEIPYLAAYESQAVGPPVSDVEMGNVARTWDDVAAKIETAQPLRLATDIPANLQDFIDEHGDYPSMFTAAFGSPEITSERIAKAIGVYERTLISDESPFDAFLKGDPSQLTPQMESGRLLFNTIANCATCHVPPFLMDNDFHNIGTRPDAEDMGRFDVTGDPADVGKFKTQNARNAVLRGSMFHNGAVDTIEELVEFYDRGGDFDDGNLDPEIFELNLTEQEKADLVVFVRDALLDPRVENNEPPFDRPTLRAELPSENTVFGTGMVSGAGDPAEIVTLGPAYPGNDLFSMAASDLPANTPFVLALSFGQDSFTFPDPRFQIPVNIDLSQMFLLVEGTTDEDGVASTVFPIPDVEALSGLEFFAQWFVSDPSLTETTGVYSTEGLRILVL